MYCVHCGAANADTDQICRSCGKPLLAANPYQGSAAPADVPYGRVPNYLVQSILVTLFCCLPFGIPAIVYAAQVDSKLAVRDYSGAVRASQSAKMWCWISFGVWAAGFAVYLIIVVIAIATGAQGRPGGIH